MLQNLESRVYPQTFTDLNGFVCKALDRANLHSRKGYVRVYRLLAVQVTLVRVCHPRGFAPFSLKPSATSGAATIKNVDTLAAPSYTRTAVPL
jgi:hypothetical protein